MSKTSTATSPPREGGPVGTVFYSPVPLTITDENGF